MKYHRQYSMHSTTKLIYDKTYNILSSRKFFWAVVLLFIVQSLWIAFSFKFPLIYDEGFHFGIIKIFTNHWWPVIYDQPIAYDVYRDFASEGSKLFHFILSFPARLFDWLSLSQPVQIVLFRVMNIAMVAVGLIYYDKLFKKLHIKQIYTNLALLILVMLPMTTFVAATINYDNALFLITPIIMSLLINIYRSKEVDAKSLIALVVVGMVASLIKFTYLAIFATLILIVGYILVCRHGKSLHKSFMVSVMKIKAKILFVMVVGSVVLTVLFIQTYVVNIIQYGTPRPACMDTLGAERCMANSVTRRNVRYLEAKDVNLQLDNTEDVSLGIIDGYYDMLNVTGVGEIGKYSQGTPLFNSILFTLSVLGLLTMLYAWRSLELTREIKMIFLVIVVYVVLMLGKNVSIYYKYSEFFATQPRYLIIFAPIILVLIVMSVGFVTRRHRQLRLLTLLAIILLFSQGGGIVSSLLASQDNWYWDNEYVIKANHAAKEILQSLVKET